jgi:hypothetical protein
MLAFAAERAVKRVLAVFESELGIAQTSVVLPAIRQNRVARTRCIEAFFPAA